MVDDTKPKPVAGSDGSQSRMDPIQREYEEGRRKEVEWAKLYGPFRSVSWMLSSSYAGAVNCYSDRLPASPPGLSRRCSDELIRFCVKFQHGDWMRLARGMGGPDFLMFHGDAIDLWLKHGGSEMITEARKKAAMFGNPKPPEGSKPKKPRLKVVRPADEPPSVAS